jgi:hypothetical protein
MFMRLLRRARHVPEDVTHVPEWSLTDHCLALE